MNGSALADAIGTSAATARKALEAMIEAGTIKRTGEKRGTRYLPA
jgi:DNA-binding Lrp family transcriptional regulator